MSTKSTIKHGEDENGVGFHVYRDWEDDNDYEQKRPMFIHLELDRCDFEVRSVNGVNFVDVKIPIETAIKIGLITGWPQEEE